MVPAPRQSPPAGRTSRSNRRKRRRARSIGLAACRTARGARSLRGCACGDSEGVELIALQATTGKLYPSPRQARQIARIGGQCREATELGGMRGGRGKRPRAHGVGFDQRCETISVGQIAERIVVLQVTLRMKSLRKFTTLPVLSLPPHFSTVSIIWLLVTIESVRVPVASSYRALKSISKTAGFSDFAKVSCESMMISTR